MGSASGCKRPTDAKCWQAAAERDAISLPFPANQNRNNFFKKASIYSELFYLHHPVHSAYTFPKAEHLKSRKLIGQLFRQGKSFNIFPLKVYYLFAEKEPALQAGFVVPAKLFKKAVHRNRIKRLMREAYRLEKQELEQSMQNKELRLAVFFVYTGRELPALPGVSGCMHSAIRKLIKTVHEKTAVST